MVALVRARDVACRPSTMAPEPASAVPADDLHRRDRDGEPPVHRPRRKPRGGRDRIRRRDRDRAPARATTSAHAPRRRRRGARTLTRVWDAVVVGSGFGGTMAAHELVRAGLDVLMLERGDWVARGADNWSATGSVDLTPYYSHEAPYRVAAGGNGPWLGSYSCVGGPSVFYGGVSIRFREGDFVADPDIVGDSGAAWPYDYATLEPWYGRAESLLGVAGSGGEDPTEPPRSAPYPHHPG